MSYANDSAIQRIEPIAEGEYSGFSIVNNPFLCYPSMEKQTEIDDLPYSNATYYLKITDTNKTINEFLKSNLAKVVKERIHHGRYHGVGLVEEPEGRLCRVSIHDGNRCGMFIIEHLDEVANGIYMHPDLFNAFVIWCGVPSDIFAITKALKW